MAIHSLTDSCPVGVGFTGDGFVVLQRAICANQGTAYEKWYDITLRMADLQGRAYSIVEGHLFDPAALHSIADLFKGMVERVSSTQFHCRQLDGDETRVFTRQHGEVTHISPMQHSAERIIDLLKNGGWDSGVSMRGGIAAKRILPPIAPKPAPTAPTTAPSQSEPVDEEIVLPPQFQSDAKDIDEQIDIPETRGTTFGLTTPLDIDFANRTYVIDEAAKNYYNSTWFKRVRWAPPKSYMGLRNHDRINPQRDPSFDIHWDALQKLVKGPTDPKLDKNARNLRSWLQHLYEIAICYQSSNAPIQSITTEQRENAAFYLVLDLIKKTDQEAAIRLIDFLKSGK